MTSDLVQRMLGGDQLALARLISIVENRSGDIAAIMSQIYPHLARAYTIGVTGPPGAGKSTLVDKLTALMREKGLTVGILAVDPTSPFTGGAVLGDRIRMQQHYLDSGVFIRSMATRGSHGGLAKATKDAMKLLDASGKDYILVETVGVGQTELDIVEAADTTVVVLVPESGDAIQTMKAGLMEIADIFVVNKADRGGADNLTLALKLMLQLNQHHNEWEIPIVVTQAQNNIGIVELYQAIERHREVLKETKRLVERRERYRKAELMEIIENEIKEEVRAEMEGTESPLAEYFQRVIAGEMDPYSAAREILSSRHLLEALLARIAARS